MADKTHVKIADKNDGNENLAYLTPSSKLPPPPKPAKKGKK